MLELRANGLALTIAEIARTGGEPTNPYDFWVVCRVDIEVPSFRGTIEWSVLQAELRDFAEGLHDLERALGQERTLAFEPIEAGVVLHLHMNALGQISAEYRLRDTSHGPDGPELRGSFGMDQTYLIPLASSLTELAEGVR